MTEVTRLLEFLCQKPTQRQDEARLAVTNSDKQLSHREVNQTFKKKKKFLCECAQGSNCGRKFCSFSSRVNESIHGKKEQGVFFQGKIP